MLLNYPALVASTKAQDQVKSGLLLDVVVRESAAILQLLSGKDQTLLVGGNAFLVLDLGLDGLDGVAGLNLQCDGLASEGLDENLHSTTETEDQVEGGFLLNVVVRESAAILQLLASEDEALLVRGDSLLVLDLGLHRLDGVGGLDLQSNCLSSEGLDENLTYG